MVFFLIFFVFCFVTSLTLEELVDQKEQTIKDLAFKVSEYYDSRCGMLGSPLLSSDACQSSLYNSSCNSDAQLSSCRCDGMLMSMQKSTVRLPSGIANGVNMNPTDDGVKDSILFSARLDPYFEENEKEDSSMEWQGFGSWNGMMRIYPGRSQETCGSYDPRLRSWYAAASSGPKDVVIVLDRSGSMRATVDNGNTRWTLAVEATKSVLKTLSWNDYVGVVLFDGNPQSPGTKAEFLCGIDVLVPATSANKEMLNDCLDQKSYLTATTTQGYTDFEAGLVYSFQMLNDSRVRHNSSKCSTAILFLSDGYIYPSQFLGGGADKTPLYDLINQKNNNLYNVSGIGKAVLFTYSLGSSADTTTLGEMACRTDGIFQEIPDSGDLVGAMSSYYVYFSIGLADRGHNRTVWVEPYNFSTDGTLGTSVSIPIYDYNIDPPLLIGVAATGMSLGFLESFLSSEYQYVLDYLTSQSETCTKLNISKCQMEGIRARAGGNQCPPTDDCPGVEELVNPHICGQDSGSYPSNMWSNVDNLNYLDRACCCDSTDDPEEDNDSPSFPLAAIIGIAAGGGVGLCCLVVVILVCIVLIIVVIVLIIGGATGGAGSGGGFLWFKKKKKEEDSSTVSDVTTVPERDIEMDDQDDNKDDSDESTSDSTSDSEEANEAAEENNQQQSADIQPVYMPPVQHGGVDGWRPSAPNLNNQPGHNPNFE